MAPRTADVIPVHIVRTSGSVTGAKGLTRPGTANRVTLTMVRNGAPPTIVVDYGKDVGGIPYFVVRSVSRPAVLQSAYSEGLQYLGPGGDQTASASPAGDASRADDVTVAYPGRVTTGSIQGGERYERISLTTPGTLTLSSVGVDFTAVRATAGDYRGWFDSSSAALNRIWYDGAYTTQLDELPADSVPAPWHVTGGSLDAVGGGVEVLRDGVSWTDYTMSFDTRVVDDSTEWMVRASSASSGYLFVLHETPGVAPSRTPCRRSPSGPDGPPSSTASRCPRRSLAGRGTTCRRWCRAPTSQPPSTAAGGHLRHRRPPPGGPCVRLGHRGARGPGLDGTVP